MEFCFPDSTIVLQSDGVGDSTPVKQNNSFLAADADTSPTGSIIQPVSGQFDDLSSGENLSEKIHPEETEKNSKKLEKNDSGIEEEIDSESSSTYGFSDGEVEKKDNRNIFSIMGAISNIPYKNNGNIEEKEKEERLENEGDDTDITDLEQLLKYQDEKQKKQVEYILKKEFDKEMKETEEKPINDKEI